MQWQAAKIWINEEEIFMILSQMGPVSTKQDDSKWWKQETRMGPIANTITWRNIRMGPVEESTSNEQHLNGINGRVSEWLHTRTFE